jgi:hypothetical protein
VDYRTAQALDTDRIDTERIDTERIVVSQHGDRGVAMLLAALVLVIGLIAAIWFIASTDALTGGRATSTTVDDGVAVDDRVIGGEGAITAPAAPAEATPAG